MAMQKLGNIGFCISNHLQKSRKTANLHFFVAGVRPFIIKINVLSYTAWQFYHVETHCISIYILPMQVLSELLSGKFGGRGVSLPFHYVSQKTLTGKEIDVISKFVKFERPIVVADENTYDAGGGDDITKMFSCYSAIVKDARPDMEAVEHVQEMAKDADLIVAIGSGTINDICKYAAFLDKKSYVIFPTAPSMNGYVSENASIIKDGHKKSLPCYAPKVVLSNLDVLSKAPLRLIKAGFCDLLARSTSQADWLISHHALGEAYKDTPFQILKPYEEMILERAESIMRRDPNMVGILMDALIASGVGMIMTGSSYPASQAEHMIAHTYEMLYGYNDSLHGEQIGVTTLTVSAIQEQLLASDDIRIPSPTCDAQTIIKSFGDKVGWQCIDEFEKKQVSGRELKKRNDYLQKRWKHIREKIGSVSLSYTELVHIMKRIDAPATPADIGWNMEKYRNAITLAKYTRDRFTCLDLI